MIIAKSCLSRKDWLKGRLSCWWTVCYVGEWSASMVKDVQSWWKVCIYGERIAWNWTTCFLTFPPPFCQCSEVQHQWIKETKRRSTVQLKQAVQYRKQSKLLPFTQHTHILHPTHRNKVWYIKTNSGLFLFYFDKICKQHTVELPIESMEMYNQQLTNNPIFLGHRL